MVWEVGTNITAVFTPKVSNSSRYCDLQIFGKISEERDHSFLDCLIYLRVLSEISGIQASIRSGHDKVNFFTVSYIFRKAIN